jgi:hypothetical protein
LRYFKKKLNKRNVFLLFIHLRNRQYYQISLHHILKKKCILFEAMITCNKHFSSNWLFYSINLEKTEISKLKMVVFISELMCSIHIWYLPPFLFILTLLIKFKMFQFIFVANPLQISTWNSLNQNNNQIPSLEY